MVSQQLPAWAIGKCRPARARTPRNTSSWRPCVASQLPFAAALAALGSATMPAIELALSSEAGTADAESASVEMPCDGC